MITRKAYALILLVIAAGVLAACGSDSDDGDDQAAAGGKQTQEDCVSTAEGEVEKAQAEIPVKVPKAPLNLEKLSGKQVWMITGTDTPFLTAISEGFTDAASAAGMEGHVILTSGALTEMTQGVEQAVSQGADGISLLGIDPALVSGSVKKAVEQDIPIVDTYGVGDPDRPLGPVFARVSNDFGADARILADWVLADSSCEANMAILSAQGIDILKPMVSDGTAEFKELCPEDCSVQTEYFDISKIATELGPQVQTLLRRDPDIDYLFPVLDAAVPFIIPALQQAGLSDQVKIVSHDGLNQNLDIIRDGGLQTADMAYPSDEWIGWAIVDQLGRALTGEEPEDWTSLPLRLIDGSNVGESNPALFPGYADFSAEFERAWTGGA